MSNDEKIESIYHDPSNPGGFGGADILYQEVKKKYPSLTKKDVRHFLEGSRTYTLFKPRKYKFPTSKTIPLGFMTSK
jgi:hypothetical protein